MTTLLSSPPAPRLSPRRRTLLTVGVSVMAVLIGLGGLSLVANYGHTTYTTVSDIAPTGQLVGVSSGSGDVEVHASPDSRIHVETRVRYGFRRPRISLHTGPNGIELRSQCRWFDSACSVDYHIGLPSGLDISITTDSGNIKAAGVTAPTQLTTGSGDITGTGMAGSLVARTGSGAIRLRATTSRAVTAKTGSGDISAEFSDAPTEVSARTGSGTVTLTLPGTLAYAVDIDTGSGDRSIDVPTDPRAERHLFARTGSGDVRVRASAAG
ncbi:MAG: DUF4097 family beta strand repeat-containing protein [Actinomycetota bacterium]